jgi:hypothetical protein
VEVEVLTAQGQLSIASEFRFDIWRDDDAREHEYITVKRGPGWLSGRWAIAAGESAHQRYFNVATDCWSFEIRGADAYVWELEPALLKAQELLAAAKREREGILERRKAREAAAADRR